MGNEAFKRRLSQVPVRIKAVALAQIEANAEQAVSVMKSAVPRQSGALADSIRIEVDEKNLRVLIKAGDFRTFKRVRKSKKGNAPYINYARFQEFGTQDMPANPYFWPIIRLYKRGMRAKLTRVVNKAIKEFSND